MFETTAYNIIYAYSRPSLIGELKIGETTLRTAKELSDITEGEINNAAIKRIKQQTGTARVEYHLELAQISEFSDHQVRQKLNEAGFEKTELEWVRCSKKDVINVLHHKVPKIDYGPVEPREEQGECIRATNKEFVDGSFDKPKEFLWNCIMRFGKTLTAYWMIQDNPDIRKVLIMTHRPVVSKSWKEDYIKVFKTAEGFGSSYDGDASFETISKRENFVYFTSIQDLRGSAEKTNEEGEYNWGEAWVKNSAIFKQEWDLVITDEAHEGTLTQLARDMKANIRSKYWLYLSGTPFNILNGNDFKDKQIFSYDYIAERKNYEKYQKLMEEGKIDENPYGHLPRMNIYTYDTQKVLGIKGKVFTFNEFFKIQDEKFRYETYVQDLLNKIQEEGFPYSDPDKFKHTFWLLPHIPSAIALEKLLNENNFFKNYKVINATGNHYGNYQNSLLAVKDAIKKNEKTITLSVRQLTTGTTIPEWSAVLMLNNMSSPAGYLQTIFRAKNPYQKSDGSFKTNAYCFDFAPDRALRMAAYAAQISIKGDDRDERMSEFLNFCPVFSAEGTQLTKISTETLMTTLKKVYILKVFNSGFEDKSLYSGKLSKLTEEDVKAFEDLKISIGSQQSTDVKKAVVVKSSNLTEAEIESLKKAKPPLTEEQKKKKQEIKKEKENRNNAIKILRAVSVRIPLLVFGSNPKEKITVDNFPSLIDDESWAEFMPKGFGKIAGSLNINGQNQRSNRNVSWEAIKKYFDSDIFAGAVNHIIERTKYIDELERIEDKVVETAKLFAIFRNPDKETVLTSFRVINYQMAKTLKGYRWLDNNGEFYGEYDEDIKVADANLYGDDLREAAENVLINPVPKNIGNEKFWLKKDLKILDINSKTALYPLYCAASIFLNQIEELRKRGFEVNYEIIPSEMPGATLEDKNINQWKMWENILENNIFINCKVPYSKKIAKRVLCGYKGSNTNISVVDILRIREILGSQKDLDMDEVINWIFEPIPDKFTEQSRERAQMVIENKFDEIKQELKKFA